MNMFSFPNGSMKKIKLDSDSIVKYVLMAVSTVAVLVVFFILIFILNNSTTAIKEIGIWDFITGGKWKPSEGLYGASSVILGTLLVTFGAIVIAIPLGVGTAIFMSEVADKKIRKALKPAIEIFAGIPSVVYGFFGLVTLVPLVAKLFPGQTVSGFGWLTGSLLLGIMALPTIVSVSEDALRAVPRTFREASLAMGATRWETTSRVVVPAAISGIASAVILGIGRAVGETMAVMMVTGNSALIPEPLWDVFSYVRTITATLALEMPEVVVGSTHYSALFLLGLILMLMVFAINHLARQVVKMTEKKFRGEHNPQLRRMLGKKGSKQFRKGCRGILVVIVLYMILSLFVNENEALFGALFLAILVDMARIFVINRTRETKQKLAHWVLFGTAMFCALYLVWILGTIVIGAIPALNWDFLTQYPRSSGTAGGILPAIVGTIELIIGTAIIALPVGILSGTYLTEYSKKGKFSSIVEQAIDVLNGTPSIVFGLFGVAAIVVLMGLGISLIGGCITLSFMILPVIIRTTEEAIRNVPREIREASYAMGANKWQTTFKVVLPAALGGIMTGSILGLGRAAGETAPIMFTAVVLMKYKLNFDITSPVMALPYHLYYLATEGTADPSLQYATALVLLAIVLAMFLTANYIRERSSKKTQW